MVFLESMVFQDQGVQGVHVDLLEHQEQLGQRETEDHLALLVTLDPRCVPPHTHKGKQYSNV